MEIRRPQFDAITLHLTREEVAGVRAAIKSENILDTDYATDAIAISSYLVIVNREKLSVDAAAMLADFWNQVGVLEENVILFGKEQGKNLPDVPGVKIYENYESIRTKLPYILLDSKRKSKQSREWSRMIADCLIILRLIRDNPYISTKRIEENMDFGYSSRTIQRYINTLRMSGEWINYDPVKRGWYLIENKSLLLGELWVGLDLTEGED